MIQKFKSETNWGTSFLSIETFASETVSYLITADGKRVAKSGQFARYFDTLDEAEGSLIREQNLKIQSANDAIHKAKARIEVIQKARIEFEKMLKG